MDHLIIRDDLTIAQVQTAFKEHFENLKIEFYEASHGEGQGSAGAPLPADRTIGSVRTKHDEGELSINGHQKVATLEDRFEEVFGLHVQVFRKSGQLWMQTTRTDDWTLSEQNREGHD